MAGSAYWNALLNCLCADCRATAGRLGNVPAEKRKEFKSALCGASGASRKWEQVFSWLETAAGAQPDYSPGVPILVYGEEKEARSGKVGFATTEAPGFGRNLAGEKLIKSFEEGGELAKKELPFLMNKPFPEFYFDLCQEADGESSGLSGFMAILFHLLNLPFPRRWAATGAVEKGLLAPLNCAKEALLAKAEAARDFGFDTLLLVEGEECPRLPRGMKILLLRPRPKHAIEDVLRLIFHDKYFATKPLSSLFLLMDRYSRSYPKEIEKSPLMTAARRQDGENGYFANLVYGHALLHLGKSAEALKPMARARELKKSIELFGHPYQSFIKWESVAKDSVCWLDNGHISPANPRHRPLVEADATLAGIFKECPNSQTAYARLVVSNTLALLHEYQGRLDEDPVRLRVAFDIRWRLRDYWEAAFLYESQQSPSVNIEGIWNRQRNYLVDSIYSLWLCGEKTEKCAKMLVSVNNVFKGYADFMDNSYDIVSRAKDASISGLMADEKRVRGILDAWQGLSQEKRLDYPGIKVPELVAWHCPFEWAIETAKDALRQSSLRKASGDSIESLLRLRNDAVLARVAIGTRRKKVFAYKSSNHLFREIAKQMGSKPEEIFRRCPY